MEYERYLSDDRIKQFCQQNHISKMLLFGSVLRDDFSPHSDIDVLVEFAPGFTPGFDFFLMEVELSRIVGRKVDLQTLDFLSSEIRSIIFEEAVPVYEQT